jgi:hypothetical protein
VSPNELDELEPVFAAIETAMRRNREAFNQLDTINGNHGDHLLAIFNTAVQAAAEKQGASLAETMKHAAERLLMLEGNGSARVYASGLASLAEQCRKYEISLPELRAYVESVLVEDEEQVRVEAAPRAGEILKALAAALAGWKGRESGEDKAGGGLDLGYMFDLGVAYLQARQRGGGRAEVIAETAVAVSPLAGAAYRREAGRAAIVALLEALGGKK